MKPAEPSEKLKSESREVILKLAKQHTQITTYLKKVWGESGKDEGDWGGEQEVTTGQSQREEVQQGHEWVRFSV